MMEAIASLLVRWSDNRPRLRWSKVHVRRCKGAFSTCCGRWIPQGRREENGAEVQAIGHGQTCVRCWEFVHGGQR